MPAHAVLSRDIESENFHAPTREILSIPLENLFGEIERYMRTNRHEAALALLGLAEHWRAPRAGRYPLEALWLSRKGLCLALAEGRFREAEADCLLAVGQTFVPPECFLNLGRVNLAMGKRRAAYHAFRRGLELHPADPALEEAIDALGIRRARALPALPREHWLNRVTGHAHAFGKRLVKLLCAR